jgi:hypothetical protein
MSEPIDPKLLAMMPPRSATPSYQPLPGAEEALATGQPIPVRKENRKTLPPESDSDFDPHTGS